MRAVLDKSAQGDGGDRQPIAVRRKRRNSAGPSTRSRSNPQTAISEPHGLSTPPTTPKRAKKRVRFSDPESVLEFGPTSSSLTPFFRRTSLSTPIPKGRHFTPAKLWNLAQLDAPISGTFQFEPLREVLTGRVQRRIRRNRLSEEINSIEGDKRHEAKARKSEVEKLRERLAAKDREVQRLRDTQDIASQIEHETPSIITDGSLGAKVQHLEQQIEELKAELKQKEIDAEEGHTKWTLTTDPFNFDEEDDMIITTYDQEFSLMNDELMTTPTRLNTSFPSPPSTMPNTPCKSSSSTNAGVQASLPVSDPEKDSLRDQLASLQLKISELKSAIALNDDNHSRLVGKLSDYLPVDEDHDLSALDSALDSVLTQLALSQSHTWEKENAFSILSNQITRLGFYASGPEETLETIARQFRQARIELEYATPGEVVEGFENSKLLDMLLSRVRVLVEQIKERDQNIDQYHEQELLLRQQLNTRIDAQHDIQRELYLANTVVQDLRTEIDENEVSNKRLQRALDGYRAEVKGLETLVENIEKEGSKKEDTMMEHIKEVEGRLQDEMLKHDTTRAADEGKEMIIVQLEQRLNAALTVTTEVQKQIDDLTSSTAATVAEKDLAIEHMKFTSKSHGDALALRDDRVSELRGEIERVNEALKTAHSTILLLRKDNKALEAQIEVEKTRGQFVVQAMREQLNRVLETGMGYINGDVCSQRSTREGSAPPTVGGSEPQAIVRRGRFLDGGLARRSSGKKRRRYDSGLGFLEEEEVDVLTRTEI